jgi:O-antigen ligase
VYGPDFWTGRGFGLHLAEEDGFIGSHSDGPPLRSPHNVYMTVLARAGVPGAVLWALFLALWFGMVMHAMLTARHRGQTEWAGLFLFICCYVMAIIIDATFDVAIEGPMVGIWFWCLVGFGIGSVMVYRRIIKMRLQRQSGCESVAVGVVRGGRSLSGPTTLDGGG